MECRKEIKDYFFIFTFLLNIAGSLAKEGAKEKSDFSLFQPELEKMMKN